jgi:hypothetical protein
LKDSVTEGNWPWWLIASGAVTVVSCAKGAQRHRLISRGLDVDFFQRGRCELELRLRFEDHAILVELRENDRDLPLAKGVVKRVVDGLRGDVEVRGFLAVDVHAELQAAGLLVAGYVDQARLCAEFREELRRPCGQLGLVGVLERVLVLRAAHAACRSAHPARPA